MNKRGPTLLDSITYLPAIRSRQAELRGYQELRAETKDALFPIVSLGKLGRVEDPQRVLELVRERVGPCFVDLNTHPGQTCGNFGLLCASDGNYRAWRDLAESQSDVIPVALLRDGVTERPFIRQVLTIEDRFGTVVIRSRRPSHDLPALQASLSAVEDVNNVLIVLDLGYVRDALGPKESEARRVITALRMTDPSTRVAVISSSFPRAVSAFGDARGVLQIVEREIHQQIGGNDVAIYGDHAAIYPEPFEPSISRWVPRIDYCLDDTWIYERRREDNGGYKACADALRHSEDWEPMFAERCWGASVIREVAENSSTPQGFNAPANWIAARVNMHIERQTKPADATVIDDDDIW